MQENQLIPHLFRTEYRKIISVLCKSFGLEHIEIAEDIASDTFLLASETWGQRGLPKNPAAWLYAVAKNKTKDLLRHDAIFAGKVASVIRLSASNATEHDIDLSNENIYDSQLQMMFAICDPCISAEAQVGLALNILCGFGAEEIAVAFLTNKEVIYKRLSRAKDKLKAQKIEIALPPPAEIPQRLENVLTAMYLLFSEGYYSSLGDLTVRKDLCLEAMRLTFLLTENSATNTPAVNALLSLMCFHASRFEARLNQKGDIVLYEDQDTGLWNQELISRGTNFLNLASTGDRLSRYHLEAAIAYWHTHKEDAGSKWENILQLYNRLLQVAYSPVAALNRTYALSKANGKAEAIAEALKLKLEGDHLYHLLLGELYRDNDPRQSLVHLQTAFQLSRSVGEKNNIAGKIDQCKRELSCG